MISRDALTITLDSEKWRLPPRTTLAEVRALGTLWVYAEAHATASITFNSLAPGQDPPIVSFASVPSTRPTAPVDEVWLHGHRWSVIPIEATRIAPDRYTLTFPVLSRALIRASALGWCSDFRTLDDDPIEDGVLPHYEFALDRAYVQAGRLLDECGQPVPDRVFSCLVIQRSAFDAGWGQMVAASRVQGEGISAVASEAKDYAIVQARYSIRTDANGCFTHSVARKGELRLMIWDPEFHFKMASLGESSQSRDNIEFVVTRSNARRWLLIKENAELLKRTPLVLMNYSHWPSEVAVTLVTTDNGEIDAGNLPSGEWFGIQRARTPMEPRVFQLGAQSELDLALLQGATEFMNSQGR